MKTTFTRLYVTALARSSIEQNLVVSEVFQYSVILLFKFYQAIKICAIYLFDETEK